MTSNVLKLTVVFACATASSAWADDVKAVAAQEATSVDVKDANDAQLAAAAVSYGSQHGTIMRECGVDPVNEKKLWSLLESWDEATKSVMATTNKGNPDLAEKLEALDKEMIAARESNNSDLVQDLSQKRLSLVELITGWNPETQKQLIEVDTKYGGGVREVVAPDKLEHLDEILLAIQNSQPNRPRKGPVRSPRALQAIVDRLGDLTPEQRRSIDNVFQQFRDAQRTKPGQSSDKSVQERKLYDDVFAVLTNGQKTRVEQQLAGRAAGAAPDAPNKPATPAVAPAKGGAEKP